MLKQFDETKKTKWFVNERGELFSCRISKGQSWEGQPMKKLKPNTNKKRGYLYARTSNRNHQIHRLVATCFIPNTNNKPCVNHKNSNKHDNNVTNLEWVTVKENLQHARVNGRWKAPKKNEGKLKYTTEQCRTVLKRVKRGMTYVEAGSMFNMPYSTVAHLVRGSRRLL